MQADHKASVSPEFVTQLDYFCFNDSSFFVLSDQATLIGVSDTDKTKIIKQNITNPSAPTVTYTASDDQIMTLAVDEAKNRLLAGSNTSAKGLIVQYDLSTGEPVKSYDQIGFAYPMSSIRLDNLYFFGSDEASQFIVIDADSQQMVHQPVSTAIKYIFSMVVCNMTQGLAPEKVMIYVVGEIRDYSDDKTDVFDITDLVKQYDPAHK